MASVGQKDTGAELLLRRALHRLGQRYKIHVKTLPGSPDLVFPRFHSVVFVHGCYWHSHGCYKSTIPKTRQEFWQGKFATNRVRDAGNVEALFGLGWRVLTVWECALLGKLSRDSDEIATEVVAWLRGKDNEGSIEGFLKS